MPNAVPARPQPPSAASESITQVRAARLGSLAALAMISVASLVICCWPSLVSEPGGVMIWTRTVREDGVFAVEIADPGMRWMKGAVLSR